MSPAFGPFSPDEDPDPNKATLTFFTSSYQAWPATQLSSKSPHAHGLPREALTSWELQCSQQPSTLSPSPYGELEKDSNSSSPSVPYDL